jgi:hypothetical protein
MQNIGYQLVDVCNRNKFEVVTKIIKSWLYSWMQPWQCETEKEYNISKSLLFAYMQSLEVVSVMGQQNASRIFQFIRENVEPHESHYCFHKRKTVRHYDTFVNSAHEGTNNGLKNSAAPVLPQYTIDQSASVLTKNASVNTLAKEIAAGQQSIRHKLWSDLPTSKHLNTLGESLIVKEWELHKAYGLERVALDTFHVKHCNPKPVMVKQSAPIPLFQRVRLVKICRRRLYCSCEYFSRIGLPCRHIMCILTAICPEYKGVTHHDVSVVWWSIYSLCGYSKSNNNERFHEVSTLCESLRNHDVDGPLLPLSNKLADIPVVTDVSSKFKVHPAECYCSNYSKSTILQAMAKAGFSNNVEVNPPAQFSQETILSDRTDNITFPSFEDQDFALNRSTKSFYECIIPLSKEIANVLDSSNLQDDGNELLLYMSTFLARKRGQLSAQSSSHNNGSSVVSVCALSNKRRKTHGTKPA